MSAIRIDDSQNIEIPEMDTDVSGKPLNKITREEYLDNLYFDSDNSKKEYMQRQSEVRQKGSLEDIQEIELFFSIGQFMEVFLYHLLFNVLLGPFAFPILRLVTTSEFIHNMGFYPEKSNNFINQSMNWFFFTCVWVVAVVRFATYGDTGISTTDFLLISITINMLMRQIIIAIKYAYYTEEKYEFLKKVRVPPEILVKENAIYLWLQVPKDYIFREIGTMLRRNDIDLSLLYMDFIVKPDSSTDTILRSQSAEIKSNIELYSEASDEQQRLSLQENEAEKEIAEKRYFAGALIFEMVYESMTQISTNLKKQFKFIFLAGFISSLVPFMSLQNEDDPTEFGFHITLPTTWMSIIQAVFFGLSNSLLFSFNVLLFFSMSMCSTLKFEMMSQLSDMVSLRKKNRDETLRRYPTINLFDKVSLKTWSKLRRMVMDFGKKYQLRGESGLTFQLGFYITWFVFLTFKHFTGNSQALYSGATLQLLFQFFGIMSITVRLSMNTALTNQLSSVMKGHVQEFRNILADIIRFKADYIIKREDPKNVIYRVIKKKLQEEFQHLSGKEYEEATTGYLQGLIECLDDTIDEITFDEKYNPARVMNIPITISLFKRICLALFGVVLSFAASLIKNTSI